jgi:hypothetical protein
VAVLAPLILRPLTRVDHGDAQLEDTIGDIIKQQDRLTNFL